MVNATAYQSALSEGNTAISWVASEDNNAMSEWLQRFMAAWEEEYGEGALVGRGSRATC